MDGLVLTTAPTTEPVTLTEAKARLRVTITADDTDITDLITQCRAACENECQRAFYTQTWTLTLDKFPAGRGEIRLPMPPLQSVTYIKYYDANGVQQTWSSTNYLVLTGGSPGRVQPIVSTYWPVTQTGRPEAVEIRFVCGYTSIPTEAKSAVLMLLSERYDNPAGAVAIPPAVRRVLDGLETGQVH